MKHHRPIGTMLAAALALAACGGGASSPTNPPATTSATSGASTELSIFAAASLRSALEQAQVAYEATHPGVTLAISTDSSAALETQIEQGAPSDVFLSADTANPKKLVDAGFAAGAAVVFAGNKLTIIVPTGNPAGVESAQDLAEDGLRIIAAGDEVPITKYAKQLLANLAREPGYPVGFEAAVTANIVTRVDNVKAVVAQVELGQGDAAIVYVTDAQASTKVESVAVPDEANVTAEYAGVLVGASAHQRESAQFLAWLAGPDGQAVLGGFGFLPPPA